LPLPLVSGLVAEALPGAVLGEDSPGPAVVPVLPDPPGVTTLPDGLVVAPLVAEPVVPTADPVAPVVAPLGARASRMQVSRSVPVMASQRRSSAFLSVAAAGSPADLGLATPPVGAVPTAPAPEGPSATMVLSPAADAWPARDRPKAAASATTINFFIAVS